MASEDRESAEKEKADSGQKNKSPWAGLNLGLQFGVTMVIFVYGGHWLDQKYDWSPWGALLGAALGMALATYMLIKEAS